MDASLPEAQAAAAEPVDAPAPLWAGAGGQPVQVARLGLSQGAQDGAGDAPGRKERAGNLRLGERGMREGRKPLYSFGCFACRARRICA
jgi:hypothetical protein